MPLPHEKVLLAKPWAQAHAHPLCPASRAPPLAPTFLPCQPGVLEGAGHPRAGAVTGVAIPWHCMKQDNGV